MPNLNPIPAPGSPEAIKCGCACPVLDNAHGEGWMGGRRDPKTGETLYVISAACDLHREWERHDG